MELRIIGAGLGRTGTLSLKLALERLLSAPCYHMMEVISHPEHIPVWREAARGRMPEWRALFAEYAATVDWPAAAFWPELSEAFPDAIVLLSLREPESWWRSASDTIFPAIKEEAGEWRAMIDDLFGARFTNDIENRAAAIAALESHNARVREMIPPRRLVEWHVGDGWSTICSALGVAVPDEPFPHTNTTDQWRSRHGIS